MTEASPPAGDRPPAGSRPKGARFPLRLKLSFMAAALTVLPLAGVGLLLINFNVDEIQKRIREFQIVVADDIAQSVRSALHGAENALAGVGRLLTDPELDPNARLALALASVGADPTLDAVSVYGADGRLIDTMREENAPVVPAPDPLPEDLRRAARQGPVAIGRATFADQVRVPLVIRLEADGRLTGYVASMMPMGEVQARVDRLASTHFPGLPDPLLVVDEERRIVARGDRAAGPMLSPATASAFLLGLEPAAMRAGLSSAEDYTDATGRELVGAAVRIPDHPWAVVVQQPREVVYGTIDHLRLTIAGVIILAIIVALGVAILVARRISEPLRDLSAFAADLAARRFDKRVAVHTQDELALLGAALSGAAADLQASEDRIREELAIRSDLGRYLPGDLVDKVVRREQDMGLGGRRTPITVIFADVVGFTPLTERLPPEKVVTVLNELFTILTEIIFRHGGTVDKFIGDCVMAMWGAPRAQTDHAARALRAAEDMMRWLEIGNAGWKERFGITLELAIGVNSGEAVVGNIGSEIRMEYTAIGDVVNVASRLESIARPMQILVSGATRQAAGEAFEYVALGSRELPGRSDAVTLYEVRP